ncbi:hypothetical protein HK098_008247, partial [Nowakowskiella sp. JEL0407]
MTEAVFTLLDICASCLPYKFSRVVVCGSVIKMYDDELGSKSGCGGGVSGRWKLRDCLGWYVDKRIDIVDLRMLSKMYASLMRFEVFSYTQFLQRLIARGLLESQESKTQEHETLLKCQSDLLLIFPQFLDTFEPVGETNIINEVDVKCVEFVQSLSKLTQKIRREVRVWLESLILVKMSGPTTTEATANSTGATTGWINADFVGLVLCVFEWLEDIWTLVKHQQLLSKNMGSLHVYQYLKYSLATLSVDEGFSIPEISIRKNPRFSGTEIPKEHFDLSDDNSVYTKAEFLWSNYRGGVESLIETIVLNIQQKLASD